VRPDCGFTAPKKQLHCCQGNECIGLQWWPKELGFNLVAEKLSTHLNSTDFLDGNAAVVALLRECNQELELLFVKRTETPKDPWSGQIAFPGGKAQSSR